MRVGDGVSFLKRQRSSAADISGFYINLPIGGLAAILLFLIRIPDESVKATNSRSGRFDFLWHLDPFGFIIFAGFAVQILLALEWGGTTYPWNSSHIIGLFCGAGLTLIVFAAWEVRIGDVAMIPLSVIRQRVVWSSCLVMALFFGQVLTTIYYLPIYFQSVKGYSPIRSGVDLLPTILPQITFAILSGVLGNM
jgi:hypothetical protein